MMKVTRNVQGVEWQIKKPLGEKRNPLAKNDEVEAKVY